MAIAATSSAAALWAITPEPGEGNWGWLYACATGSTVGQQSLTYLRDSGTGLNNCSLSSKAGC